MTRTLQLTLAISISGCAFINSTAEFAEPTDGGAPDSMVSAEDAAAADSGTCTRNADCMVGLNEVGVCTDGACTFTCADGFADCDTTRGCETDLSSPTTCGACDVRCDLACRAGSCTDPSDISAGEGHTCLVLGTQEVACWGGNGYGQLGSATPTFSPIPVLVPGLDNIVQVEAGGDSTCALTEEGRVLCWGRNSSGQLGNGNTSDTHVPTEIPTLPEIRAIAVGVQHACALGRDHSLHCWGSNVNGELGLDLADPGPFPTPQEATVDYSPETIAAGNASTCSTDMFGRGYCWGANNHGQLGVGDLLERRSATRVAATIDISEVRIRGTHGCGRSRSGSMQCWGLGTHGELGNGAMTSSESPVDALSVTDANIIAVGDGHTCVRRTGGTISCWGFNATGALGDGTTNNRTTFVPVPGVQNVTSLAAGSGHTCVVAEMHQLLCWGAGIAGQLGNDAMSNSTIPVEVVDSLWAR